MKNFFLAKNKRFLFKQYWLSSFTAWFLAVFAFFFVLFFANQLLFFGKRLLELNFSLSESLLFTLSTMPGAMSWAFPVSLFLAFFWLLSSLIYHNELLAWQVSGISLRSIGSFLLLVSFLFSLIFFTLNDFSERGSYYLRIKILDAWQNRVPASWVENNHSVSVGEVALATLDLQEGKKVYIFEKLRERRRDYLIIQGSLSPTKEGLVLDDVFFFSPASGEGEAYYKGKAESLSLKQSLGSFFSSSQSGYPLSFIGLSRKLFTFDEDRAALKRIRLFWHQKAISFLGTLSLAVWAWFLVIDRLAEGQRSYPFWMGFIGAAIYLNLVALSRILMAQFWHLDNFSILWIPIFVLWIWTGILILRRH